MAANTLDITLSRGLKALEIRSGSQQFVWNNASIPCVPGIMNRGLMVEIGGNPVTIEFGLQVPLDAFLSAIGQEDVTADQIDAVLPQAGQTLRFRGRTYRIYSVSQVIMQSVFTIQCVDQHSCLRGSTFKSSQSK